MKTNVGKYKVKRVTYVIIILWIIMGLTGVSYKTEFDQLAVYFLSLSGFGASYVFGELKRPSKESSIFMKGPSSSREKMFYYVISLWFFIGLIAITQPLNLAEVGSYFASLTPFVSGYIIGQSYKPETPIEKDVIAQEEPFILNEEKE